MNRTIIWNGKFWDHKQRGLAYSVPFSEGPLKLLEVRLCT